jgi:NAD(P)H-flavin reductase
MDPGRLKESFARVTEHGDQMALFFYADLFLRYPRIRDLFPVSMAAQRGRLLHALGRIVARADQLDQIGSLVRDLGRDHRKFGPIAEHVGAVGDSLLATLAHFSGPDWTPELAADWAAAYQLIATAMTDAAAEDARCRPACWDATVVAHEQRTTDIAVIRVVTTEPMAYRPGQYVAVESPLRPRVWRFYSIANAPRPDGTLDFHVKVIGGGTLSPALVRSLAIGARLRLGPPLGSLTLREPSRRGVLLIAGGTGLSPLKAIVEQLARLSDPPRTRLFFGAPDAESLYDLPDLEKISAGGPWLTVTPCASADPYYPGERGTVPDVAARSGAWAGHDVYVAGPAPMVEVTAGQLRGLGVPPDQIYVDDFGWSRP